MILKGIIGAAGTVKDPFFKNVSLLLRMNGVNGSTAFLDSSRNKLTVTSNGSTLPSISTDIGGPSPQFQAVGRFATSRTSGRYLTIPNSSLFAFGAENFTVEFFCYRTVNESICRFMTNGGFTFELGNGTNGTKWIRGSTVIFQRSGAPAINQWVHVAISKSGTTLRLFYNGVQQGSGSDTGSYTTTTGTLFIGDFTTVNQFAYVGFLDSFRITKGIARYTSNFSPPTIPF